MAKASGKGDRPGGPRGEKAKAARARAVPNISQGAPGSGGEKADPQKTLFPQAAVAATEPAAPATEPAAPATEPAAPATEPAPPLTEPAAPAGLSALAVSVPARITRLRLRNWRNLRRVDVALSPLTFVIGLNGAGKSNLLAALRFLAELAGSATGLRRALERVQQPGRPLRSTQAAHRSPVSVGVDVLIDGETWSYDLSFDPGGFGALLREDPKKRDDQHVVRERVRVGGRVLLERPDLGDAADPHRLREAALGQTWAHASLRPLREALVTMQLLRLESADLRVRGGRSPFCDRTGYGLFGDIGYVAKQAREALLRRISAQLLCVDPELSELTHLRFGEHEAMLTSAASDARGGPLLTTALGEAALRLLAMLWYASAEAGSTGPVLIDQPETSLHKSVVRALPGLFTNTGAENTPQLVLASSSLDLVADPLVDPAGVLVVRSCESAARVIHLTEERTAAALLAGGMSLHDVVDHFVGAGRGVSPPGKRGDPG